MWKWFFSKEQTLSEIIGEVFTFHDKLEAAINTTKQLMQDKKDDATSLLDEVQAHAADVEKAFSVLGHVKNLLGLANNVPDPPKTNS